MVPKQLDIEFVVRSRLKALRVAHGWSLDDLATRSHLSPSTLSRIETGKRTIGIDVLVPLCRALHADMAELLDVTTNHDDVVIRPVGTKQPGRTMWPLTRNDDHANVIAAKWRIEPSAAPPKPQVHPGHDWFFVLAGTARLTLGERTILVSEGEAAEFSTMTPHSIDAHESPVELLVVFDRTGHQAHAAGAHHEH